MVKEKAVPLRVGAREAREARRPVWAAAAALPLHPLYIPSAPPGGTELEGQLGQQQHPLDFFNIEELEGQLGQQQHPLGPASVLNRRPDVAVAEQIARVQRLHALREDVLEDVPHPRPADELLRHRRHRTPAREGWTVRGVRGWTVRGVGALEDVPHQAEAHLSSGMRTRSHRAAVPNGAVTRTLTNP
eukprot:1195478-Prorocentrum_minimum.AAC.2